MKRATQLGAALALAAAALAQTTEAAAQQAGAQEQIPQIITSASGETQVTPDRARIDLTVETRGATAAAAAAENARIATTVQARLRALGLTDQQLGTWGYSVHPEYNYNRPDNQPPRITGYVARNTVRADLRRIDQVGLVIDAAIQAGANNVGGLDFYSSSLDIARQRALAQAVERARADAQVMAAAAGGRLGPLLELSSSFMSPGPMPYMRVVDAVVQADQTPVQPGERTVTATVSARWRFLPP
jgi:uncharacterized protein YggE